MARKQADYLSSLLAEPVPTEAAAAVAEAPPPSKNPMTLLARESALARVATGEVKQVTELRLNPSRVRIWQGNPRHQESLNEDNCRDLIDTILSEGGQKVAAIVRRVSNDPDYDYEVIAGSRRHWAISWLRANNYPEMTFLAQVHSLDDEAAFRISDIENRSRKDVSDFERARTYMKALELHYGGRQARLAERLNLTKGWLSKLMTIGAMPDWLVAAFSSPADITTNACYPLAQKVQTLANENKAGLAKIRKAADVMAQEQARRRSDGQTLLGAVEVAKRLLQADQTGSPEEASIEFSGPSGRTALSVLSANRNGVSIRLHCGSGATDADLARMLREALGVLEKQGRGLQK